MSRRWTYQGLRSDGPGSRLVSGGPLGLGRAASIASDAGLCFWLWELGIRMGTATRLFGGGVGRVPSSWRRPERAARRGVFVRWGVGGAEVTMGSRANCVGDVPGTNLKKPPHRGDGRGSRASSARTAPENLVGVVAVPQVPELPWRSRCRCVGDGSAPMRVGRRRRPSEVATANAGRAVRSASWSSRDGAVLSQRETSIAPVGAHDARRACSLSVMGSLRGRSRVSKTEDAMGANFCPPAAASSPIRARTCRLRHAGPTRWTGGHAGAVGHRVSSALPCCPSPKICCRRACGAAIGQLELRRHP